MKMPSAYWIMAYTASKRKHNHRCQCCNKIVADGEQVYMARIAGFKTRVLHVDCASRISFNGFTCLQYLEAHGMGYLASCGWKEAKDWLIVAPINKSEIERAKR